MKVFLSLLFVFAAAFASDSGHSAASADSQTKPAATSSEHTQVWSVQQAMTKLQEGNARFVKGKPNVWDSGASKREKLTAGQTPYACVITCADSRVPPEQIFDAGLGELFVIRVAGNVTPVEVMASADYAVGHLGCPVVIVMGHTKCGAVGAALAETDFPEPLNSLVNVIRPSVAACEAKGYGPDDLYEGAIKENARMGAASLVSGSRSIEQAVSNGSCVVLSAVYELETGTVNWQSQLGAVTAASSAPAPTHADNATEHSEEDEEHKSVAKTEKKYSSNKSEKDSEASSYSSRKSSRKTKSSH